jgi:membrane protein YdbS with pleckstrin-like domain
VVDDALPDALWRPISRLQIRARIWTAIGWCSLPLATGVVLVWTVSPWWWFLAGPFAVILAVTAGSAPFLIPRFGWAERDLDLIVRKGWLSRETTAIPFHRLQTVDLAEGPLEQRYGLAQLTFTTAASNVVIPGLPKAEAEALRDRLVAHGVRLRKTPAPEPAG